MSHRASTQSLTRRAPALALALAYLSLAWLASGCRGAVSTPTPRRLTAAQASDECAERCSPGAVQCRGAALETCSVGPEGCAGWTSSSPCAAGYCSDSRACGPARCENDQRLVCERAGDPGCERWRSTPCPGTYCFDDERCGHVRTMQFGSVGEASSPAAATIDGDRVWMTGVASGALPGGTRIASAGGFLMAVELDSGEATTSQWADKRIAGPMAIEHSAVGPWVATRSLAQFTDPMRMLSFDEALALRDVGWSSDVISAFAAARDGGVFVARPGAIERRDADGKLRWSSKTIGAPVAIAALGDDDIVTAVISGGRLIVRRTAADGRSVWRQDFAIDRNDEVSDIAVAPEDGAFYLTLAMDRAGGLGARDWGVMRFESDGTRSWTKSFGSIAWDEAPFAAVLPTGELALAGTVGHRLVGGSRFGNVAVLRVDRDGSLQSQTQWGASHGDRVAGVGVDDRGRTVVIGRTEGTLGPRRYGPSDIFVSVLEPDTDTASSNEVTPPPTYTWLDDEAASLPDRAGVYPADEDPANAEVLFVTTIDRKPYVVFPAPPQDAWKRGGHYMWGEPSVRAAVDVAELPASIRRWVGRQVRVSGGDPLGVAKACVATIGVPEITAADSADITTVSPNELWLGPRRMLVAALATKGRCKSPMLALADHRPAPRWYRRTRPHDAAAKSALRAALVHPDVVAFDRRLRATKRARPEAWGSAREGSELELWSDSAPGIYVVRFSDGMEFGEQMVALVTAGAPMRVIHVLSHAPWRIEVHDLDGDGAPELVTSDTVWELAIYRRDGDVWRLTAGLRALPEELE